MSREQIKYGMVGGGINSFIGGVHRNAIAFDRLAELKSGCFSRDNDINIKTGNEFNIDVKRVYNNYHDMAQKEAGFEDKIDFVVIVTPNNEHYNIAKEFLLNGISVVCEKPLCFETAQAEELKRIADDKKLLFAVSYAYTSYSMVKFARRLIKDGKIGDIINVKAEYLQDWLLNRLEDGRAGNTDVPSCWRMDPVYSGISNCVGDIGTHVENIVAYTTDLQIKRVCALTNKFGYELDLQANILVEYTNGTCGSYVCSQVSAGRANGFVLNIFGTKGSIEWHQEMPDILKVTYKGQPTEIFSRGMASVYGRAAELSRVPCGHPEGYYIAFANFYKTFISAVSKRINREPVMPKDLDFPSIQDGINGVKFINAVIESSNNDSKWVSLSAVR